MGRELRKYQKFSRTLPPAFGDFARAYLKTLQAMTGAEIGEEFGDDALEKIKRIFPEKFQMDEDLRAKSIGKPSSPSLPRRSLEIIMKQAAETRKQFEADRAERLKGRVHRPLVGARISNDFGKNWKLYCLCDECVKSVKPPQMLKNEGAAGAMKCDWCEALNEK